MAADTATQARGTRKGTLILNHLSSASPLPLHYQLRQRIATAIARGELRPGDLLPTEEEFAAQAGISRTTVRQALAALVHEGLIERKRARGTRVAEPRVHQELTALTGFVEDMLSHGLEPLAKVIAADVMRADGIVAEQLRLPEGARIVRIERIRFANGRPMRFDISHLPAELGERIVREDLAHRQIFTLLEEDYGVALGEADYRITAVAAGRHVARHLEVAPGAPLLMIECTTYTQDGAPIDYEKIFYRGGQMTYFLRLKRRHLDTVGTSAET